MNQVEPMTPEVAGFVLDLAREKALVEVGEVPYEWLETRPALSGQEEALEAQPRAAKALLAAPEWPKVTNPAKQEDIVEAAAEIWHAGEAGGVVIVVAGDQPVGEMEVLVQRMLAAVGCDGLPCGWVGVKGELGKPGALAKRLGDEVASLAPKRVLILGGAMLQAWLGKATGVEAWRPGSEALEGLEKEVAVGVTYAPEMLLAKPLFKRLAWRHLQTWEGSF